MQPKNWKEWEKPLLDLEDGIAKLKERAQRLAQGPDKTKVEAQIAEYEATRDNYLTRKYANLDPWEEVLVARAEKRPYTLDYIGQIFSGFVELHGDRRGHDDQAIIGGPAILEGRSVMVIGHQKGRDVKERAKRNFAMAKPEGYRKAMRLMDMADRFGLPVISFVDTPAADPGVESESRGISEAIAASMMAMFSLKVPVVSVVIGEGGSGGAIGIACANKVYMLQHAIYSVIPPEGCAAILWRKPEMGPEAARALRLTAKDALQFGLIDEILPEPVGGAHRDAAEMADTVKSAILSGLDELTGMDGDALRTHRHEKFRGMGVWQG